MPPQKDNKALGIINVHVVKLNSYANNSAACFHLDVKHLQFHLQFKSTALQ